jgi:hypothetical protein
MKNISPHQRHADHEHVVRPDDERQEGDGSPPRRPSSLVAEQRLARKGRDDLELTAPNAGRIMM